MRKKLNGLKFHRGVESLITAKKTDCLSLTLKCFLFILDKDEKYTILSIEYILKHSEGIFQGYLNRNVYNVPLRE